MLSAFFFLFCLNCTFGLHIIYFAYLTCAIVMNCDHEDNNALINAFVFKHAVTIKRAYARTSWATGFMSLCSWKTICCMSQTVFGRGLVRRPDVAIVDIRGRIVFCYRPVTWPHSVK